MMDVITPIKAATQSNQICADYNFLNLFRKALIKVS